MTMLTLAQQALENYWFGGKGNSFQADETDGLYMFILWVCIISFVILMAAMFWFVLKYRRGAQHTNYQVSSAHNTVLELGWSIVPLIVMVPIFFWGFKGYIDKQAAPSDSEEIMVRGQKWNWTLTYDNGGTAGTETAFITESGNAVPVFYAPANRPVKFILTSSDVIHSFFIPDFRTKIDVFPNRYTAMWIEPREVTSPSNSTQWRGVMLKDPASKDLEERKVWGHAVYCAEYCGDNHSEMAALLIVLSEDDYNVMKAQATEINVDGDIAQVGEKLRSRYGCNTCHTIDGSVGTGPSWKMGWGHTVAFADGGSATYDENYIVESILNPGIHIHQGFPNQMPSFQSQLGNKPDVLDAFVRYIKFVNGVGGQAGNNTDPAHEPGSTPAPSGAPNHVPAPAPQGQEHAAPQSGAHN